MRLPANLRPGNPPPKDRSIPPPKTRSIGMERASFHTYGMFWVLVALLQKAFRDAPSTREGAGSREVAAWDVPGAPALRGGPQAGLPAAGPPPERKEGCVARPFRWPDAGWLPCGGTGESLGGSHRRWSASAGPPWLSRGIGSTATYRAATMCVCVCLHVVASFPMLRRVVLLGLLLRS